MTAVARPLRTGSDRRCSLALPRGALFGGTLDLLERIGVETAALRGDSRSLVFESDALRLVTMRPSDVPTYVEAGAADLGITGKDVLAEQADRAVYELVDLGYGTCRMVLAGSPRRRQPRARPSGGSARCGSRPSTRGPPSAISSAAAARPR